jgi:hypothetical protein
MWSLTDRRTARSFIGGRTPWGHAGGIGGLSFGCCPIKQVRRAAMANSPRTGAHLGPFQLAGYGMGADRTDVDGGGAQPADVGQ